MPAPVEQPEILKLLRSAGGALPLDADPWGTLAAALRMKKPDLLGILKDLRRDGVIHSIWGEANPTLVSARERLIAVPEGLNFEPTSGEVIRWSAGLGAGHGRLFSTMGIEPGHQPTVGDAIHWHKIGVPFILEWGSEALLSPTSEKTWLVAVPTERHPMAPMGMLEAVVSDALFKGVDCWETDLWAALAEMLPEAAGRPSGEQVRQAVRYLLRSGILRRLCLRVSLTGCGFKGCGLASWKIPPESVASAASALAGLRGTGDVVIRRSDNNLHALFIAAIEGEGEKSAMIVSRQWGIPLASWQGCEVV